jgi:excisionase family DNA binding protein
MEVRKPPEWLTATEVAEELRIPRKQVYEVVKEGDLPPHRIAGRTIRISRANLDTYLANRRTTAGPTRRGS